MKILVNNILFCKILFIFILPVSCADNRSNDNATDEQLSIALGYYTLGKINDAKNIVNEIIDRSPGNAKAYFIRGYLVEGEALYNDGSIRNHEILKEALSDYEKAHRLEPENITYHLSYLAILVDTKNYALAVNEYQKVFAQLDTSKVWTEEENFIFALYNYFIALNKSLDKKTALSRMQKWLNFITDKPLIMSQYYYAYLFIDIENAEKEIEAHMQKFGFSEQIKEEQCNAYHDMGNVMKAKACFEDVINQPSISERLIKYAHSMKQELEGLARIKGSEPEESPQFD